MQTYHARNTGSLSVLQRIDNAQTSEPIALAGWHLAEWQGSATLGGQLEGKELVSRHFFVLEKAKKRGDYVMIEVMCGGYQDITGVSDGGFKLDECPCFLSCESIKQHWVCTICGHHWIDVPGDCEHCGADFQKFVHILG